MSNRLTLGANTHTHARMHQTIFLVILKQKVASRIAAEFNHNASQIFIQDNYFEQNLINGLLKLYKEINKCLMHFSFKMKKKNVKKVRTKREYIKL